MRNDLEREVLAVLRDLRCDHGNGQKEILEAITRLDAKITRLHADVMSMAAELGLLQSELTKTSTAAKTSPQDANDTRKERRRSSRLH